MCKYKLLFATELIFCNNPKSSGNTPLTFSQGKWDNANFQASLQTYFIPVPCHLHYDPSILSKIWYGGWYKRCTHADCLFISSLYMMYKIVSNRHSCTQACSDPTVPVFGQPVREIRGIPGALCLVLLNRLLYVLYTMLHHWHFGQREGFAAKGASSCCSFHLS